MELVFLIISLNYRNKTAYLSMPKCKRVYNGNMKHPISQEKLLFTELLPNEKLLTVQKQHWSALLLLFISHAFIMGTLATVIMVLAMRFHSFGIPIIVDGVLVILSLLALIGTYAYMDWHY